MNENDNENENCHPDSIASRFTLHASRSSLPLGEDGRGLLIYHSSIPSFIQRIADTPAMQRLKGVGMNCGCEYTHFPHFLDILHYTRYEHSVGVGLIVWHFTHDVQQSIAALLHDIATPTFAHVIDFFHGDYEKQESTEERTLEMIAGSAEIVDILKEQQLQPTDVSDYHLYPIADNDTPQLSADRLEYTLGNILAYHLDTVDTVQQIYESLIVGPNEHGIPELMFSTLADASRFANLSLQCSRIYVGNEDRYAMEHLAELLADAVQRGVISEQDFYGTEQQLIARLQTNPHTASAWQHYCALSEILIGSEYPNAKQINAKKRHINPYVLNQGRTTDLDANYHSALHSFLSHPFDEWLSAR